MARKPTSGKHRIGLIILIILILSAVALVIINPFKDIESFIGGRSSDAREDSPDRMVPVRVAEVERRDLRAYIRLNGDVVDMKTLDIYPEVTGKITRMAIEVGDRVALGEVIARIDPSRPGMVYRETAVTAPAEGTVLAVNFPVGSSVSPQAPLVRLGMLGQLEVEVAIAERHIGKIGIGSEAVATFAAYPGREFAGTVVRLAPVLNPATRTLKVGIAIEDPDREVKAGMFPTVMLHTERIDNALVLDRAGILHEGDQAYVFTVDAEQTVHRTNITLGLVVDDTVQITTGLKDGDIVVIQGQTLLTEGTVVSIVE